MPFTGTASAASLTLPLPAPSLGAAPPAAPRTAPPAEEHPISATLAANEALAARRLRGEPVLPLAFGEAGLPAHPALREALAASTATNGYGPVAGFEALRSAAAGYWQRRGLATDPGSVVCGPGSKPLIFGLLLAIGGDVIVPRPSWVSYAAQASLVGARPHFVPAAPGEGGICDPAALGPAVAAARAAGRDIRSVIVTLPDNPTGRVARPETIRAFCAVAAEHDLVIISDEIYRDLVHSPATPVLSPAAVAPERTVVTTALSKSLALGGWRIGVARLPEGALGERLRGELIGIGSEIWSAPAAPIQQAAALAFSEPAALRDRVAPGGRHARRRGRGRPGPAGRVLRLPGLRALAGTPGAAPRRQHRRGPRRAAARALRGRHPARQRVRREPRLPATADSHRVAVRRERRGAGGRARSA